MNKINSFLNNRNNTVYLLIGFSILLVILNIFSKRISFHDAHEYIVVAKSLAGIHNIKLFTAHSIVYPFIISLFLKVMSSELIIKFVDTLWIILIGILLLNFKSKKLILLYIFSPMVYILFPHTTPALPVAFFFLLGYIFIKNYEETRGKLYFILAGLSLGMCFAIYTPAIILILFFIFAFFYDKKLGTTILFLLTMIPTIAIRFIIDQIYFGFPFYTLIRYMGSNFIVSLGLNQNISFNQTYHFIYSLPILIIGISPLLFLIFKAKFKQYKKEMIFLIPSLIFFIYRGGAEINYIFMVAPIILLILSEILTKKQVIISIILSLIITPFLISDYFGKTSDEILREDILAIKNDFNPNQVLAGKNLALVLAAIQYEDSIYIVWPEELKEDPLRSYRFVLDSKADVLTSIEFVTNINLNNPQEYKNLLLIERKNQAPGEYKELKCYQELCVYEK
ncbi:MAG: hypothetical protein PHE43_02885 [Candidatus Nanoarchaeia archaeon]|nr:hypothetical protein [Candidatus Nanoarchaeia archaeon]